jgi:hypothetical protein
MAALTTVINPFVMSSSPPASRGLTERDFAMLYNAAEFAEVFELWLDTTVTLSWRLMGVEEDVPTFLAAFTKCLRDWLEQRHLPVAWIYAHESGPKVGLHTHLNLFVPGMGPIAGFENLYNPDTVPDYRGDFRAWARGWPERQVGRRTPNAIRVRGPRKETPWLHWLTTSYLLKGYDPYAIVQSARNSPDGRAVLLGDLIAWPWRDGGSVPLKHRVGVSRSLGPERRALGVPGGFDYLLEEPTFQLTADSVPMRLVRWPPRPAFRSTYEDGTRDVRRLYPAAFYDLITRLPRLPAPLPKSDESDGSRVEAADIRASGEDQP